jgi:hypothetical protein
MKTLRELHDEAMRLANLAMMARHNQEWAEAEALARQAYECELQAAELTAEDKESEPTRSILYRSSASLAYQFKDFAAAQRLIAKGLSGFPPPQVEQELKDLYEQVNFEHHLRVRGVELENEDFQMSIQGQFVGWGTILYDEFLKRLKTTRTIIDRTVQRVMRAPYQRSGRIAKAFRPFTPALSTARQGSFAITIKLATVKDEQIPMFVTAAQVIDEIMAGMELVNNDDERGLRDRIQEEVYCRNFIALTRDMAPDGEKVNFVGFTSPRKSVGLTRLRSQIEITPQREKEGEAERTPIRVEGVLDFATARRRQAIGLTTQDGKEYEIVVQEGLDDLVKEYFRQWVVVTGLYDKRNIYLSDVQPSEE